MVFSEKFIRPINTMNRQASSYQSVRVKEREWRLKVRCDGSSKEKREWNIELLLFSSLATFHMNKFKKRFVANSAKEKSTSLVINVIFPV